jgi:sugar lactone lactonase YvrE
LPGNPLRSHAIPSQLSPGWSTPTGIAVDGSGNLFVVDSGNVQVVEVPWTGTGYGPGIIIGPNGDFALPLGIAVDAADNVYVADGSENYIFQLTWDGSSYGGPNLLGGGYTELFNVAVDTTNNLYAVDYQGNSIFRIPWTGSGWGGQTTVFGAQNSPNSIAIDNLGNGSGSTSTTSTPSSSKFALLVASRSRLLRNCLASQSMKGIESPSAHVSGRHRVAPFTAI